MTAPTPTPRAARRGGLISAAKRLGMTPEAYAARVAGGEKWCNLCQDWHDKDAFGRDASRPDGRSARCKDSDAERGRRLRADARPPREAADEPTEPPEHRAPTTPPADVHLAVLWEVLDMARARRPHGEIADHIVATVGRP